MLKKYYKLELKQTSPLHLSNGDSQNTDSDLMKDSRNLPFIPGTGLIGAMRDLLSEKEQNTLFGWINGEEQQASRVIGSDAVLPAETTEKDIHVTYRDGVSLDPFWGTAVKTAKYDLEVVETKKPYSAILEWTGETEDDSSIILDKLIDHVVATGLSLGGKVTRGYGAMQVSAWKKEFHFPDDLPAWLTFDPRNAKEDDWTPVKGKAIEEKYKEYEISFQVVGPIAIRVYSTEAGKADFNAMKSLNGQPVIPGTSWAGAFRHRMLEIAGELGIPQEKKDQIDAFFGKLKDGMKRSAVTFSETEIEGGKQLEITRNALDRFTSGPAMTALFTAGYWYGGEGTLKIKIFRNESFNLAEQLLMASIRDLDIGLMTLGGNASTGLGQIRIREVRVDGVPCELHVEVKKDE